VKTATDLITFLGLQIENRGQPARCSSLKRPETVSSLHVIQKHFKFSGTEYTLKTVTTVFAGRFQKFLESNSM
jgi:hypothetical protein